MALSKSEIETLIRSLGVLVVDSSQFMRKIVRIGSYYGPEPRRQYSDPIRKPVVAPTPATPEPTPSADPIISRRSV